MNIINGGAHANNGLRIQEFMIRPDRAKSFSEAMRICFVVIKNLSNLIKNKGYSTSVGDEGGFAPMISSNNQALDLIVSAIKKSGFVIGKDVSICLDVAANELLKKNKYSPFANFAALLLAFENPKFSLFSIILRSYCFDFKYSTDPSVEQLSITNISLSICFKALLTLCRQ